VVTHVVVLAALPSFPSSLACTGTTLRFARLLQGSLCQQPNCPDVASNGLLALTSVLGSWRSTAASSGIRQHESVPPVFTVNITTGAGAMDALVGATNAQRASHGTAMTVAWVLFSSTAVFSARFMRGLLKTNGMWFKIHMYVDTRKNTQKHERARAHTHTPHHTTPHTHTHTHTHAHTPHTHTHHTYRCGPSFLRQRQDLHEGNHAGAACQPRSHCHRVRCFHCSTLSNLTTRRVQTACALRWTLQQSRRTTPSACRWAVGQAWETSRRSWRAAWDPLRTCITKDLVEATATRCWWLATRA
jgi:hypothetical protein